MHRVLDQETPEIHSRQEQEGLRNGFKKDWQEKDIGNIGMDNRKMDTELFELYEILKGQLRCYFHIFKFSATVRKVIYTTNAIEWLNSAYQKLSCQRSIFPSNIVF